LNLSLEYVRSSSGNKFQNVEQQGKPDGQMYCDDIAEPVEADVGWQIANAVDWQTSETAM